ncbi:DUF6745 domain-containing protein [Streptomyces sp. MAR4 CNX-425]|uniref:DUF6745 domain-containing protein n=1 Tax=Streptomyces sp. MAR4 CNX-425 TaxID=3406343 RepID=UPI003B50660A
MTTPRGGAPRFDGSLSSSHACLAFAVALRDEWLGHALSTLPADRPAAEAALTGLYRLAGAPPPRFRWIPSPAAARPVLRDEQPAFPRPRLRAAEAPARWSGWPVASRLASLESALRTRLNRRVARPGHLWRGNRPPWSLAARTTAPEDGLADGYPLRDILWTTVHGPLHTSLLDGPRHAIRTALTPATGTEPGGLTFHGQHDAHWIGHHDVQARLGLAPNPAEDARQFALWAAVARSAGWWWPGDGVCVVAERPVEVHTEPLPGARQGEVRLHHPRRPAVRYADGAEVYALHGTAVPRWVVEEPTVARIHGEPNVEVRRCAIERIGWDTYIDQAGLRLLAGAPDPGNPGSELRLYRVPRRVWGAEARVLLAVNGSVEPDGRRRRYGLSVPAGIDDPVAAAGWSYGLTGAQYARMARRT